ncbi:MAG: sigma-70 family RNA polymerase sigma factor [Chloroflexi bacterium]|nr:sigma-70 family RNA polymerase sigma factor [Chloroflexota bacterium]
MIGMEEELLITAAKAQNLDAFNELVLAYQTQVYNVALHMLNDLDEADEATQQTFIAAYQKIHTFKGGSFQAWILRIVTNKCYDMLRSQKRHPTQSIDGCDDDPDDMDVMESATYLQDDDLLPEEQVAMKELEAAVQRCIEALPLEFRSAVVLIDLQGMDYQSAAQASQVPLGTVKSRLARARSSLVDCLHKFKELLPAKYRSMSEGSHE